MEKYLFAPLLVTKLARLPFSMAQPCLYKDWDTGRSPFFSATCLPECWPCHVARAIPRPQPKKSESSLLRFAKIGEQFRQ